MRTPTRSPRRTLRVLVAFTSLALAGAALTACSSSGNQSGEITITCASCQNRASDPSLTYEYQAAQAFNKKYAGTYHVKTLSTPLAGSGPNRLQYYQRLALAGDLPDFFQLAPNELLSLAKSGKLLDWSSILNADPTWKNSFNSGVFDPITQNGHIWAIPETRDAIGIYYNKDIFAQAGIKTFPSTWAQFDTDCKAIKALGKTCFAMDGDWVTLLMWANLIGTQNGGAKFLATGIKGGTWSTNPAVVKATETLKQWHTDGYVNDNAFSGDYQNAATTFISGAAAMIANGPWMVGSDIKTKNAIPGLYDKLGYATSPGYASNARGVIVLDAQGTYASGTTDPKKKEAVEAFAKFLGTQSQAYQQISVEGAWPAVKFTPTSAQKAKLDPLAVALVAESTKTPMTYTIPTTNGPTGFESTWINLWPGYVKGDESAADFLKQLQASSTSSTGN